MPDFFIRIRADAQQFGQVITNTVNQLNSKLTGAVQSRFAGFFGAGALAYSAKSILDYASQFNDSAKKLGVGVEFLQEAAFAAKQTGASFGAVEDALKRLQIAQAAALGGRGPQTEAFGRLGVTLADLKSKNVEQIFTQIAANVQKANPSAQQLADTVALLGRSADDLLPAFREGFGEAQSQARELGLVINRDLIQRLDDAGDRAAAFGLRFRATIIAPITGFFAEAGQRIADFAEIYAGGTARIGGILSKGGSINEARAEFERHRDQILDRAKARMEGGGAPGGPSGAGNQADLERQQSIKEAQQRIAMKQAQLAIEQLRPEQQLNDLLATRAQLLRDIANTADELRRAQLMEALVDTELVIAKAGVSKTARGGAAALSPIGQDQFARMGLYVTGGTAGLAQSQVGLLRAANVKLDAIKSAIDSNTTVTRNILD